MHIDSPGLWISIAGIEDFFQKISFFGVFNDDVGIVWSNTLVKNLP